MLEWFRRLLPREELFFDLFSAHADCVLAGAIALRGMLEGGAAASAQCELVMKKEHDADVITREVLIAVRRTFITPIDRTSIRELITAMDNTIDQMQKTAKTAVLFDVDRFEDQMRDMGDVIVQAAQLMKQAIPLLRNISSEAARISSLAEQMSALEGKADDIHDSGLKALFRSSLPRDGLSFFIGHEIYDHLEKVVDRFDDAANVIHGTVIEHV